MADPSPADGEGSERPRGVSVPDLLCGATFFALGAAFALGGSTHDIGSAFRMGPGYVPLALGLLLAGLGLLIAGLAFVGGDAHLAERGEPGPVPWRGGAFLVAAVLFFGLTVGDLGLAPALFVTTLLAALAGRRPSVVRAVVTAAGLTALCLLVFVSLLQLRLPLLGPWLGG